MMTTRLSSSDLATVLGLLVGCTTTNPGTQASPPTTAPAARASSRSPVEESARGHAQEAEHHSPEKMAE